MKLATIVSIPLQREGTFRHREMETYPVNLSVSIPFKREGTFRLLSCRGTPRYNMFQFPSGHIQTNSILGLSVSIPFKREGTFRR